MKCGKLVRDNVCFIIEEEGGTTECRVLTDKEYKCELIKKMHEDTDKYSENCSLDNLANMWEVFRNIIKDSEFKFSDVLRTAMKKREESGSFTNKIYLESFDMNGIE